MNSNRKSITPFYTLIHVIYWPTYCLMFAYATLYLQSFDFNNSQIGLLLGLSYALSATIQPVIASFYNRHKICMSTGMAILESFVACLALSIILIPGGKAALAVRMVLILMFHHAQQPFLNSIQRGYELRGVKANFSLSRGVGSAAYSVTSLTMGQLMKRVMPRLIPVFYLCTLILLITALFLFRAPTFGVQEKKAGKKKGGSILRRYPRIALFLLGVIMLASCHMFICNFMLQLMQNVGGGSAEMGVALAVAAIVELPSMALYSRLRRKIDPRIFLTLAGFFWTLKAFITFLAASPKLIYVAALMQSTAYALYLPSMVDFLLRTLPEDDFLNGQALSGTAFTLGSLVAMIFGGRLLDVLNARASLGVFLIPSVAGMLLFLLVVPDWKNSRFHRSPITQKDMK